MVPRRPEGVQMHEMQHQQGTSVQTKKLHRVHIPPATAVGLRGNGTITTQKPHTTDTPDQTDTRHNTAENDHRISADNQTKHHRK